jgi:hypothetical protein
VLITDAVRDDCAVPRLLLAEHGRPPLELAPRTHDNHGDTSYSDLGSL